MHMHEALLRIGGGRGEFLSEERVQEQALFNVEAIAHSPAVVVVVFVCRYKVL